jgi:sec-independent protein translocase protein TatA
MVINNFADILGLGVPELVIILVILLVLFGGKKLPSLARSIGSSVGELRKGVSGDEAGSGSKANSQD